MYRIYAWNRRKCALFALTWKTASRHDQRRVPADFATRQAARQYAQAHPERLPHGFMVLQTPKSDSENPPEIA